MDGDYSSKAWAVGGTGTTTNNAKYWAELALAENIHYQGIWSAGTYQIKDLVLHNGSSWIANAVTTQEPSDIASQWDVFAAKGTDGTGIVNSVNGEAPDLAGDVDIDATHIPFDNTLTTIAATQVQDAIDKYSTVSHAWNGHQRTVPVALTFGGTVTPDLNAGQDFTLAVGGSNFIMGNPTNQVAGKQGSITITNHGTTPRTITSWSGNWKFPGGVQFQITQAIGAKDIFSYQVEASGIVHVTMTRDSK